jgi:hypothetical protein
MKLAYRLVQMLEDADPRVVHGHLGRLASDQVGASHTAHCGHDCQRVSERVGEQARAHVYELFVLLHLLVVQDIGLQCVCESAGNWVGNWKLVRNLRGFREREHTHRKLLLSSLNSQWLNSLTDNLLFSFSQLIFLKFNWGTENWKK